MSESIAKTFDNAYDMRNFKCSALDMEAIDMMYPDYEHFYKDRPEWKAYLMYCANDNEIMNSLQVEDKLKFNEFHKLVVERCKYLYRQMCSHKRRNIRQVSKHGSSFGFQAVKRERTNYSQNVINELICRNFTLERFYRIMLMKSLAIDDEYDWNKCYELIDEANSLFEIGCMNGYTYSRVLESLGQALSVQSDQVDTTQERVDRIENESTGDEGLIKTIADYYKEVCLKRANEIDKDIFTRQRTQLIKYVIANAPAECPTGAFIFGQLKYSAKLDYIKHRTLWCYALIKNNTSEIKRLKLYERQSE